jgi:hypothetical protein
MHDASRDLVIIGTQHSTDLKSALNVEREKSKALEGNMKRLDEEIKRADELLYRMIPKKVADRLRNGESTINLCEVRKSAKIYKDPKQRIIIFRFTLHAQYFSVMLLDSQTHAPNCHLWKLFHY